MKIRHAFRALLGLVLCAPTAAAGAQDKPTEYFSPAWSRDGKTLALETYRQGEHYGIATVHRNGTDFRALTANDHDNYGPQFSPDGGRIVFASSRDGHVEVYVMNADGSGQRRITVTPSGNFTPGTLSPDGKQIAFHGRRAGSNGTFLYIANSDGSAMRAITDSTMNISNPQWSSDGRKILFTSRPVSSQDWVKLTPAERDGFLARTEIFTINADGSGLLQLTTNSTRESSAVWSIDGRAILFVSYESPALPIHRIDADGKREVAAGYDAKYDGSVLSPDGRYTAFSKRGQNGGVYVMELATGMERRVAGGTSN